MWARLLLVDLAISKMRVGAAKPDRIGDTLLEPLVVIWDWLTSLGLAHDPSCFLHARVSEALRFVSGVESSLQDEHKAQVKDLRERLKNSDAHIEILALRPLV